MGDSLGKIAKAHGLTVEKLLLANPALQDRSKFQLGTVMVIPDGDDQKEERVAGVPPKATTVRIETQKDESSRMIGSDGRVTDIPSHRPTEPEVASSSGDEEEFVLDRKGDYRRRPSLNSRHGRLLYGITSAATKFLGTPYVFGGTSDYGIDCSGFTMRVFMMNGIKLPRTADVQYNVGAPVASGHEQPGDLVFFETYCPGPSHVGIYWGNNNFIHASSSKGVTISNLGDSYFKSRYLGARRYF